MKVRTVGRPPANIDSMLATECIWIIAGSDPGYLNPDLRDRQCMPALPLLSTASTSVPMPADVF